eukprot:CAMPEP_0184210848 /NCGR_PEP_ID=MMETSP0976-20121227/12823_1 /TAXON_ID=483370 /ORGANISM="non described non described, Strain CCMP2097" /LENGTH=364 /DNA_ID=CAMNT_0026515529 /DNA_START=19 /DNA_END=1113 /DNA_ORIENTATION=+
MTANGVPKAAVVMPAVGVQMQTEKATSGGHSDAVLASLNGRKRLTGVCIAGAAVLCVTPDASLAHWLQKVGGKTLTVLVWKHIFGSISTVICTSYFLKYVDGTFGPDGDEAAEKTVEKAGPKNATLHEIARSKCYRPDGALDAVGLRRLFLAIVFNAATNLLISTAFLTTYAANVMLFYSLAPIWSAVAGWRVAGDALPPRTVVAVVFAVIAVALVFIPVVLGDGAKRTSQTQFGDLLAALAGLSSSIYFLILRLVARDSPTLPMAIAAPAGMILASCVVGGFAIVRAAPVMENKRRGLPKAGRGLTVFRSDRIPRNRHGIPFRQNGTRRAGVFEDKGDGRESSLLAMAAKARAAATARAAGSL